MIQRLSPSLRFAFDVMVAAVAEYGTDRVSRMSAAVAYRALFAVTPLFVIAVGILGIVLGGREQAQAEIYEAIERVAGQEIAVAFETFLGTAVTSSSSLTVIGFVLLLWTTSSLFYEVQNDLNDIFHVPYEATTGVFEFFKKRGLGFLWGLGIGVLVLSVWAVNLAWDYLDEFFVARDLEQFHSIVNALTPLVTLVLLPILFGLLYQTLCTVRIRRRALAYGSIFTSIGFVLASWGTELYFQWETDTSAATVAGAFFVVILVAYVLATVFLFGGVMMKVGHDYLEDGDVLAPSVREEEALEEALRKDIIVSEPSEPVPLTALFAFLAGLLVGWKRSGDKS